MKPVRYLSRVVIVVPILALAALVGLGAMTYFSSTKPGALATTSAPAPASMKPASAAAARTATAVLYTCPMESHADVVSDHSGACPKCGMALVPTSHVAHGAVAEAAWQKISTATSAVPRTDVAQLLRDHMGGIPSGMVTAPAAPGTCGSCGMTQAEMASGVECSHEH